MEHPDKFIYRRNGAAGRASLPKPLWMKQQQQKQQGRRGRGSGALLSSSSTAAAAASTATAAAPFFSLSANLSDESGSVPGFIAYPEAFLEVRLEMERGGIRKRERGRKRKRKRRSLLRSSLLRNKKRKYKTNKQTKTVRRADLEDLVVDHQRTLPCRRQGHREGERGK